MWQVSRADGVLIGGSAPGEGNVIAFSGTGGAVVLGIGAAGNSGQTSKFYPAAFPGVTMCRMPRSS